MSTKNVETSPSDEQVPIPAMNRDELSRRIKDYSRAFGTDAEFRLSGLQADLEILRDRYGVPHIRAGNEHDAFFGQAFAAAQDRIWFMEYLRRQAYGRWSELVGSSGLAQDTLMRRFRLEDVVKRDYESLNPRTRSMLVAYSEGVNEFVACGQLPIEFKLLELKMEPWRPWDCIAIHRVRHVFMGQANSKLTTAKLLDLFEPGLVANLIKLKPGDHHVILKPDEECVSRATTGFEESIDAFNAVGWALESEFAGSNNWVLDGSRTDTKKPILAGESHRPPSTPDNYYQSHVTCPEFDAIGMAFAGCPGFPNYGHNGFVAWGTTNGETDNHDLYVERFDPGDPSFYEFESRWVPADVKNDLILVRGDKPKPVRLFKTHHGPIIWGDPERGSGIAFRYPGNAGPDSTMNSIYDMLFAKDTRQMDEAFRDWADPGTSLLSADTDGGIAFQSRTKMPIRSTENGWLPVPGWTGQHEWQGFIPFEDLPRAHNPAQGYLVTANNRVVGDDYPYYISNNYAPEFRAKRVIERIRELSSASIQDLSAIHKDGKSIPAMVIKDALSGLTISGPVEEARRVLVDWDCDMADDLVAPTVFSALRLKLNLAIAESLLNGAGHEATSNTGAQAGSLEPPGELVCMLAGQVSLPVIGALEAGDTSLLPAGIGWSEVLESALRDAVEYLRARMGSDMEKWTWKSIHRTHSPHTLSGRFPELAEILDPPSIGIGGDADVPRSGGFQPVRPFVVSGMAVARYVFDLSDLDNSRWVVPLGTSGDPGSDHYSNQQQAWATYDLLEMNYSEASVESAAVSRHRLIKDSEPSK